MTASMVSIGKLQRGLSAWLNRAAYGEERIIITSHNKPKVAVISIADLRLLEDLEDAQAVREALAEYRAGETITLAELEAELELEMVAS
ncbi:MAG: type II toxin-antitoxin system Phd/YefM family antitoxin [Chloroflexi bacterium]|nr:type II toxin-antitoxin system Phd/YefM family antitoxin [Chloroflexota bacterium]